MWSILMEFFQIMLRILKPFLPYEFRHQISKRQMSPELKRYIKQNLREDRQKILFFCSSAGEYQQAEPLMRRLRNLRYDIVITFFSDSGMRFASKKNERSMYFLYPIDTQRNAHAIISTIDPVMIFIIRQEIWPCFLFTAYNYCPVFLVNVSLSESAADYLSNMLKTLLYPFFTKIFFVSKKDKFAVLDKTKIPDSLAVATGDTKYDSVIEISHQRKKDIEILKKDYESIIGSKKRFIIGSAWPDDVKMCVKPIKKLMQNFDFDVIIAPHIISESELKKTERILSASDLSFFRYSNRYAADKSESGKIIILDTMGQLSAMYGICHCAMVGGANHYQVHNVLEPAAYDLKITFGPKFRNSHEAVNLVEDGFVNPVYSARDLCKWLEDMLSLTTKDSTNSLLSHLKSKTGASDKILENIFEES